MKKRLYKTLKKYAVVFLVGLGYLIFTLWTGIGIPCPIYKLTGLKCPACGVSRMLVSLTRLDFIGAYEYNPFLLLTAPVVLFCFVYSDARYVKTGDSSLGRLNVLLWIEIFLALGFGIFRNVAEIL